MQSPTLTISLIINFGLIILCLSTLYPRLIERYRNRKKLRENKRVKEIQGVVRQYLKELQDDRD